MPRKLVSYCCGTLERRGLFRGTRLFRPLVIVSFALHYALGGLHPLGYHAVNLLLHAGVSLAVYAVGVQLLALWGYATGAAASAT